MPAGLMGIEPTAFCSTRPKIRCFGGIAGSSDNRRDSTISKLCGFLVEQPRTRSIEKPSSPNRYWNSRRLEVSFLGHEIKQGDAFNTEMPGDIGNLCATRRLIGRLSNIFLKGDDF